MRALVFTGHGLSLEPGALAHYDYLLKPLHADEFLEAVRRHVPHESAEVVRFPRPS